MSRYTCFSSAGMLLSCELLPDEQVIIDDQHILQPARGGLAGWGKGRFLADLDTAVSEQVDMQTG